MSGITTRHGGELRRRSPGDDLDFGWWCQPARRTTGTSSSSSSRAGARSFVLGSSFSRCSTPMAIYAPLIANDRPYVLEAIDYRRVTSRRAALDLLRPSHVASNRGILQKTPEEYLAARKQGGATRLTPRLSTAERCRVEDAVSTRCARIASPVARARGLLEVLRGARQKSVEAAVKPASASAGFRARPRLPSAKIARATS